MTDPNDIPIYNESELRELAERRVYQTKEADSLSEIEVRHLLHELQVHQIELEIQNEELRYSQQRLAKIYESLKRSQEKLHKLYHEAPVGYVTLNSKGIVLQANTSLAEMCGRSLHSIEGRHFIEILDPADHAQFRYRFAAFFRSPENKSMELRLNSMREDLVYVLFKGRIPQPASREIDPGNVPQGTLVVVMLEGRTTTPDVNHQILIIDPLPAGLEIENSNLANSIGTGDLKWVGDLSGVNYSEALDDRFVAALNLNTGTQPNFRLAYLARAVAPGRYRIPPVLMEDMYRPHYRARGESGWLQIVPTK